MSGGLLPAQGAAIVLVSEEVEELLEQADRIAVLFRGRIVCEMAARDADAETSGLLMSGQAAGGAAA